MGSAFLLEKKPYIFSFTLDGSLKVLKKGVLCGITLTVDGIKLKAKEANYARLAAFSTAEGNYDLKSQKLTVKFPFMAKSHTEHGGWEIKIEQSNLLYVKGSFSSKVKFSMGEFEYEGSVKLTAEGRSMPEAPRKTVPGYAFASSRKSIQLMIPTTVILIAIGTVFFPIVSGAVAFEVVAVELGIAFVGMRILIP